MIFVDNWKAWQFIVMTRRMALAWQIKCFKLFVFVKKALFKRYDVICISQQHVHP